MQTFFYRGVYKSKNGEFNSAALYLRLQIYAFEKFPGCAKKKNRRKLKEGELLRP
jgi:hypothetical protein